ncbi:hypothetical protein ACFFNY_19935 [Paenibacillus hodogayensis]|uniref:Amidase n=1 Tax=Paenibacillus hodogayensis TaxID=279208 RepID=A0ABV5W0T1_9BACL
MLARLDRYHRPIVALFVAVSVALVLFVQQPKAEAELSVPGGERVSALWVWDPGLLNGGWEQMLDYAVQHSVNRIYFGVDITIKPFKYQPFVRKAREMGIGVEALSGRASWVYPENRGSMLAYARWVAAYNAAVEPVERFAAARIDLEPHQLAEWKTDRDRLTNLWADASAEFAAEVHKTPGLAATADVPFWLDGYEVPATGVKMHDFMIGTFDELTIMAYRNYAEGRGGILDVVSAELASARQAGKRLTIGVETKENNEAPTVSFYGMSKTYMRDQLLKVSATLANEPAFAGISVHEYKAWTRMSP